MDWTVRFHDAFDPEFDELPRAVADELLAHAKLLAEFGPQLGRPHVDTPMRRRTVAARAATLIAEVSALQQLRKARKLTQVNMAKKLGIGQDGVSRIEQRSDLLISTLRTYVEASRQPWSSSVAYR